MNTVGLSVRWLDLVGRRGKVAGLLVLAAAWIALRPAAAAQAGAGAPAWGDMGMQLLGGLALFLFGMEQMAEALKAVAGDSMKQVLARLTGSRLMGLITGMFVTAIIQSSSVTTVMLVGFVTANLMSLSQAIGVILGADIGTTITAQIVAFKVTKYALALVAIGFSLIFVGKSEKTRHYGNLIMGLGMIFFGMGVMSDGMRPLRTYEPFIELMGEVSNPAVGILVATVFTGLVQSSSATMGVVIALALQGLISLEAGIALALGANIGTCATAGLAAIGKPREAVRVAVAHVTFKVVGVLIIVGFIPYLAELVRYLSPAADAALTGADKLAAEVPRQIANAHTLFNVGIAFGFLPFSAQFARFCEWVAPDKPLVEVEIARPKYLDEELIATPSLALDRVRMEIGSIGEIVKTMVAQIMLVTLRGSREELSQLAKEDDAVDILHRHVVNYLGKISRAPLTDRQTEQFTDLIDAVNCLENIGDIIETDLVRLGHDRIEQSVTVSTATQRVLSELHEAVAEAVTLAIKSVIENDEKAARDVVSAKADINRLVDAAARHQAERLIAEEPNRLAAYTMEIEVIEKLKRIYYFAKRMAKDVMPSALADKAA